MSASCCSARSACTSSWRPANSRSAMPASWASAPIMTSYLTVTAGVPVTPALVIAAVASGVIGVVVGFPALRLKGIYLAMATLGFGEMVRSFFLNLGAMGGSEGFHGMHHISLGYIWTWAAAILLLIVILERSRVWLDMRAVRDDETAAGLVGLNATAIKVGAFGFGAAVAAISGGLFAHHHVYIEPGNFSFERSIDFVLAVILGGSTVGARRAGRRGAAGDAAGISALPGRMAVRRVRRAAGRRCCWCAGRACSTAPRSAFSRCGGRHERDRTAAVAGAAPGQQGVRRRPRPDRHLARGRAARDRRRHRPQRRRQDHDLQRHHRRLPRQPRRGAARRPRRSPPSRRTGSPAPASPAPSRTSACSPT